MACTACEEEKRGNCYLPTVEGDLCWPLDAADPATVVRARTLLHGALAVLGLGAETIGDTQLGVAELVGNAVQHAQPPLELRLRVHAGLAVIGVVDGSPTMPTWPAGTEAPNIAPSYGDLDQLIAELAEHGRGLGLVQRLSGDRCGAEPTRTRQATPGKRVWFAQQLPQASTS